MNQISGERFKERRLEWARSQFAQELQTDFRRAARFDHPYTEELISVLRRQPTSSLKLLAQVLPLLVFDEAPDSLDRRDRLPTAARKAVEQYRSDYDREFREHFYERVDFLRRSDDKRIQREFRAAAKAGNKLVMAVADRWKCGVDGGAAGEWGLIFIQDWGRVAVSLNLSRQMTMSYSISISDLTFQKSFCFHDDSLRVLGICAGAWVVESAEAFPQKLSQAADLAWWHLNEYQQIIGEIQGQEETVHP